MKFIYNLILGLIGGFLYYGLEILYRGYSHYTMIILGGICFFIIGLLNENIFNWDMSIPSQMLFSSIIITLLELLFGIILNLWLELDIWDYSKEPYNLFGQICLLYSVFWHWLSLIAILLDDWLRHKLFGENYKEYVLL